MFDVVLVPSYFRPEFLELCLSHIHEAEGGPEKHVWVYQDRHVFDAPDLLRQLTDVHQVVHNWLQKFADFRYAERAPHSFKGNPLNFLEAYKEAHASGARYVYLVEDDVLVGKDFFRWHEAVYAKYDPWVSVGWHCIRDSSGVDIQETTKHPGAVVTSMRDFSSIGVCWRREHLADVVQHARPEYYANMTYYLGEAFPGSPVPADKWTEQAGLITRLLHQTQDRKVAWAGRSRVAHIGIRGYHRRNGHQFHGTLEQRVKKLRRAAETTEGLTGLSRDFFDDVSALPAYMAWNPEDLYIIQHNPYVRGIV